MYCIFINIFWYTQNKRMKLESNIIWDCEVEQKVNTKKKSWHDIEIIKIKRWIWHVLWNVCLAQQHLKFIYFWRRLGYVGTAAMHMSTRLWIKERWTKISSSYGVSILENLSIETISKSNIKYVSSGLALEVLVNLTLTSDTARLAPAFTFYAKLSTDLA